VSLGRAAIALALALGACVPAPSARLNVVTPAAQASFYPQETGLAWSYLRDGAPLDAPRFVETIQGPALQGGEVVIGFRLVGGGQDVTHYRRFTPEGVLLVRQQRPGGSFTFDPPMRELPAPDDLRVGARWSGETQVAADFPGAAPNLRTFVERIAYDVTVLDRRRVIVGGSAYDVFVIDRTTRRLDPAGEVRETLSQQFWFAPYVGRVRHENGWYLIEANFTPPPR
jgi:hypothetical protein